MVSGYVKNPEPLAPALLGWFIAIAFIASVAWVVWHPA